MGSGPPRVGPPVVAVEAPARAWAEGGRVGAWSHAQKRGAREWATGWDRSEPCPADPGQDWSPGRRGWRTADGRPLAAALLEGHRRRVQVVQTLRRAGYLARHRWGRSEGDAPVYLDGPARGLPAVDPWAEARTLAGCGARWLVSLRLVGGGLAPAAAPLPCGRAHLCPVCAHRRSAENAAALRTTAAPLDGVRALVTFTQRDARGESLAAAAARWRAAWGALRRSEEWRRAVAGAFLGHEVTRNERADTWHYHGHAVILLSAEVDEADARAGIGRAWRRASEWAATAHGRPGYGWRPVSGGCGVAPVELVDPDLDGMTARELRALCGGRASGDRWGWTVRAASRRTAAELRVELAAAWQLHRRTVQERVWSWAPHNGRGWWQTIENDDQLYQATKYPTPSARLAPLALAEWLANARGRRWHEGYGVLRGVHARAAELADDLDGDGVCLSVSSPAWSPDLDDVAPDAGWCDAAPAVAAPVEAPPPSLVWAVAGAHEGRADLAELVEARGWRLAVGVSPTVWRWADPDEAPGELERLLVVAPRAEVADELRRAAGRRPVVDRKGKAPRGAPAGPGWMRRPLPGQTGNDASPSSSGSRFSA